MPSCSRLIYNELSANIPLKMALAQNALQPNLKLIQPVHMINEREMDILNLSMK